MNKQQRLERIERATAPEADVINAFICDNGQVIVTTGEYGGNYGSMDDLERRIPANVTVAYFNESEIDL